MSFHFWGIFEKDGFGLAYHDIYCLYINMIEGKDYHAEEDFHLNVSGYLLNYDITACPKR